MTVEEIVGRDQRCPKNGALRGRKLKLSQSRRVIQSTELLNASRRKLQIFLEIRCHCLDCIVELRSHHRQVGGSEDCWL